MKTVTSPENPLFKAIRRLQARSGTRDKNRFILEGFKLAHEALESGIDIEQAVISRSAGVGETLLARLEQAGASVVSVPARLFRRVSSLETPEGILLVARKPPHGAGEALGDLVLVLAGIQNPGNLGAMARVAEAAGTTALVRCHGSTDPFQPKSLRASMGSLLRIPVVEGEAPESTLPLLRDKGLAISACIPRGGVDFREADLRSPLALVMGNEASGLPEHLLELTDQRVSIPMKDSVESLNVAMVTGLVLYEAARQRGIL
jgi:TrmH family RNA methyltransferase